MRTSLKNDICCNLLLLLLLLLPNTLLYAQEFPDSGSFSAPSSIAPSKEFIMTFVGLDPADASTEDPFFIRTQNVQVEDPAGHSCCVLAPPEVMTLTWETWGRLSLSGGDDPAGARDYLPIEGLIVDEGGGLSGELRSTVAGFPDVLTTVSGQFSENGMYFLMTIGADGGLPSGQPIQFTFGAALDTNFHISDYAAPMLGLKAATGSTLLRTWQIGPNGTMPLGVYASLDSNNSEDDADWFILRIDANGDPFYFNLSTLQFEPGVTPSYQGPIVDIPPTQILELATPPEAGTIFAFGVDELDGELNDNIEFNAIQVEWFN